MEQIKKIGSDQLLALTKIFNRRWWWVTLLVLVGMVCLSLLGVWQLDRLEQRRVNNAYELSQWQQSPFNINNDALPEELETLANRLIMVEGRLDYDNEQIWEYQTLMQQVGARLVTPLVFNDPVTGQEKAILVSRGWVPNAPEKDWSQFKEEDDVSIFGRVFESQLLPNGDIPTAPTEPTNIWQYINIEQLQPNLPYELLPVWLMQLPEPERTLSDMPIRERWMPAFSEGSHLSYAIQWFSFALIFGFGYLQFILWQERREALIRSKDESDNADEAVDTDVMDLDTLPSIKNV